MARFFENQMFKKSTHHLGMRDGAFERYTFRVCQKILFESFELTIFSKTSSKVRRVVKFQQQEYLTFIFILDQISYYWVWNVKVSTGTSHIFDLRTWLTRRATIWFASVDGHDVEKDYKHTCVLYAWYLKKTFNATQLRPSCSQKDSIWVSQSDVR